MNMKKLQWTISMGLTCKYVCLFFRNFVDVLLLFFFFFFFWLLQLFFDAKFFFFYAKFFFLFFGACL